MLAILGPAPLASGQAVDAGVTDAEVGRPSDRLNMLLRSNGSTKFPPVLTQHAGGGYGYTGQGFDATIDRDGTVRMRDRFARAKFGLMPRQSVITKEWVVVFFEVKVDFFAWLDKKFGNDPFRSERRWFLLGTYDLREKLATEAAAGKMREELARIWSQASLSPAQRRLRTFTLWDESSEDDFGQVGRAIVLSYVREHCPQDGFRGFSLDELTAFNRTRHSRAIFAPYTEADAGL